LEKMMAAESKADRSIKFYSLYVVQQSGGNSITKLKNPTLQELTGGLRPPVVNGPLQTDTELTVSFSTTQKLGEFLNDTTRNEKRATIQLQGSNWSPNDIVRVKLIVLCQYFDTIFPNWMKVANFLNSDGIPEIYKEFVKQYLLNPRQLVRLFPTEQDWKNFQARLHDENATPCLAPELDTHDQPRNYPFQNYENQIYYHIKRINLPLAWEVNRGHSIDGLIPAIIGILSFVTIMIAALNPSNLFFMAICAFSSVITATPFSARKLLFEKQSNPLYSASHFATVVSGLATAGLGVLYVPELLVAATAFPETAAVVLGLSIFLTLFLCIAHIYTDREKAEKFETCASLKNSAISFNYTDEMYDQALVYQPPPVASSLVDISRARPKEQSVVENSSNHDPRLLQGSSSKTVPNAPELGQGQPLQDVVRDPGTTLSRGHV
jgi:hypothetical protein